VLNRQILFTEAELMLRTVSKNYQCEVGTSIGYDKAEGCQAKVAKT